MHHQSTVSMLSLYNFPSLSLSKFVCMSSSSSSSSPFLPLTFNNPLIHCPQSPSHLNSSQFSLITKPSLRSLHKHHICFTFSPSNNSNYEREEARWLREEQRWLREEQRWLRQESQWNAERQKLIDEISSLKLRIQELERQSSIQGSLGADTGANVKALLQVLKAEGEVAKKMNQIAESGSSAVPFVVETTAKMAGEVVVKEVVEKKSDEIKVVKKRATLKRGAEGKDVRELQEGLQKLGFYSGEEDVEYSSFSSGTERAVKTWQASLGIREDGIMTAELLERLYAEQANGDFGSTENADLKGNDSTFLPTGVNGTAFAPETEISEIKKTVEREGAEEEVDEFAHRVFLLGENRWEDPSRLNRGKKVGGYKTTNCITCRGEGRLLCEECDGTGEPNIEEQFMDWVGEGAKCPYCEGLGYTLCDLCQGKTRKACQWIVEMVFQLCSDGTSRYVMSSIPH